jgi:hypothetical protein
MMQFAKQQPMRAGRDDAGIGAVCAGFAAGVTYDLN